MGLTRPEFPGLWCCHLCALEKQTKFCAVVKPTNLAIGGKEGAEHAQLASDQADIPEVALTPTASCDSVEPQVKEHPAELDVDFARVNLDSRLE